VSTEFLVLPDRDAVNAEVADRFVASARNAIRRRGRFVAALSGGGTPPHVYRLIASPPRVDAVDWSRVEFFWGDERTVPPDHPDSNYGCSRAVFLDRLPGLRRDAVHRMPAEAADLDAAALAYEGLIADAFGLPGGSRAGHRPPVFDLIWLGMGRDGHTASLFPGSTALEERDRWVVGTWAPGPACWRMTLTLPVLNAARLVLFAASGADKAEAFAAVRRGGAEVPACQVGARQTLWVVDEAMAGHRRAA
jgi:6-phosphogluconolactonase